MAELGAVHTSSLAAVTLLGPPAFLDEAFAGGFAVVQRQRRRDRALRAGYVEAVGVRADRRRRRFGRRVMERIGRGSTSMLPLAAELDLSCDVACDWRDGAVW